MDTMITLNGIVVTDIKSGDVRGASVASFRFLSTVRRYERSRGWYDAESNFVTVTCWRGLAMNVASSVTKGDPLLVFGRLRVRPWDRPDRVGSTVEIDAVSVGHDLNRGTSAFRRNKEAVAAEREETIEETAARVRSSVEEEGLEAEKAILEARRRSGVDAERVVVDGTAAVRPAADSGGGEASGTRGEAGQALGMARRTGDPPPPASPSSGPDQPADAGPAAEPAAAAAGPAVEQEQAGERGKDGSKREGKRAVFGLAKQREQTSASA